MEDAQILTDVFLRAATVRLGVFCTIPRLFQPLRGCIKVAFGWRAW